MYDHQRRAIEKAAPLDGAALLCEMGTGKSLMAVRTVERWGAKRVLIVAPKSLLENWRLEWERWAEVPHEYRVVHSASRDLVRSDPAASPGRVEIRAVNYERAWRMEKELLAWKPDAVVADEGHKIKHRGSKQSKCLHRLGAAVPHRLLLTGTPITQTPLDLWSQMKFVDHRVFGKTWTPFLKRYGVLGGYMGKQIIGVQNAEELAEKVAAVSFSCTLAEAVDLPPETDQVIYVELDPATRKIYNEARKHALAVLPEGECTAPNALAQLQLLQRIAGGHARVDAGEVVRVGESKLRALCELVEGLLEAGKPALVFARYRAELASAVTALSHYGRVVCLDGDASSEQRARAVVDFQSGALKMLLCQPSVGGVGLTLTAASTAIHYSLDHSLATHEQARARIRRIGQTSPTVQAYLVARGTVDEEVLSCLRGKRDVARLTGDQIRAAIARL